MANIQAENGNGKKKWKLLKTKIDELLYKYKFPKIINLDINAMEKKKERLEFENYLKMRNLIINESGN